MNRFVRGPRFWFIASAVLALALDQASKWLALSRLPFPPPDPKDLPDHVLRFVMWRNPHGLFGISYGAAWVHYVLPLVIVGLVAYFAWKSADRWLGIALGLILGGGVSNNLIDRIRFGWVVDFIDMGVGKARWPTYNLADAFAVAGVMMLLAHEFLGWGKAKPATAADAKTENAPPASG